MNIYKNDYLVRTFFVNTAKRDTARYPHPSEFVYKLPLVLKNVVGIAIRNYKFGKELLVNESNRVINILVDDVEADIFLDIGDFDTINSLISMLNTKFVMYQIQFVYDTSINRVQCNFTGNAVQSYIEISSNSLIKALGYDNGFCLARNGVIVPASILSPVSINSSTAENSININRAADMVVRIQDIETLLSDDAVTNRSSMILFNTTERDLFATQTSEYFLPLLQTQHRLQDLRIRLLNMDGELYDTVTRDAMFFIEFYCLKDGCNFD